MIIGYPARHPRDGADRRESRKSIPRREFFHARHAHSIASGSPGSWARASSSSAATGGWTQTQTSRRARTDPKINDAFKKPDVKKYVKRFESDDRENYALRHEIVAALNLVPGMAVADIGAGTGLFTRLFAEKVGPTGKVYAVDIAPPFLEHIAADAKKRRQDQVVTILGSQDSTNLPRSRSTSSS